MTREEAIKMLKSKMDGHTDTSYEWTETVRMAIEALQREPIIHCKDCKYWDKWEIGQAVCRRSENGCFRFGVDADDYCSFAERKAEQ